MKKLFIKTYGCQMNFYDSDKIGNLLKSLGYVFTNDLKEANLIVLNTCHIRDKAVEKTFSDLGRIKKTIETKENYVQKPIIVLAGCVAQAQGEEIMKRSPWVDIVVGPQAYTELPKLISKANKIEKKRLINIDFPTIPKFDYLDHNLIEQKRSAFLTIQEGCDKFCSFCVVPYTRGPEFSRSAESILEEVKFLVKKGVKEVILLGQNVNAWKYKSKTGKSWSFGNLIEEISKFEKIFSIKYTTSHPLDIDMELIKAHKNIEKLMPYLHLPIQSGSDNILKKMNRKHSVKDYLKIIEKVREYRPDIAISSDFIVGFPGESETDHEDTIKLIDEVKFSSSYSFMYSPRPGTPSAQFSDQIDENIKKERLYQIQKSLKKHQFKFNEGTVNNKMNILISEKNKKNQFVGKSPYNQTVIIENILNSKFNKETVIKKNEMLYVGEIKNVKIIKAYQNSLEGLIMSENKLRN